MSTAASSPAKARAQAQAPVSSTLRATVITGTARATGTRMPSTSAPSTGSIPSTRSNPSTHTTIATSTTSTGAFHATARQMAVAVAQNRPGANPTALRTAIGAQEALDAERTHRDELKRQLRITRQRLTESKRAVRKAKRISVEADTRAGILPLDAYGERKPRMRGWLHAGAFPLVTAASIVLICLAPGGAMKAACAVYGASAMLLFGNSALLHLGHWGPRMTRVLCALDYSNIFLIIAGTNTPIVLAMRSWVTKPYLVTMWTAALVGTVLHLAWLRMPDWMNSIIYVVLGLAPVLLIPMLWTSPAVGPAATVLIACGGACYIAGAVCFAIRKPNPVPGWFEFHEVFHVGTIAGYACHVVAVYLVVCSML